MRCNRCPLFYYSCGEDYSEESCGLFGDGWDSRFQYEDKHGTVVGCYIEKVYIKKVDKQIDDAHKEMYQSYVDGIDPEEDLLCD